MTNQSVESLRKHCVNPDLYLIPPELKVWLNGVAAASAAIESAAKKPMGGWQELPSRQIQALPGFSNIAIAKM